MDPSFPPLGNVIERFDHVSMAVRNIELALPLVQLIGGTFRDGGVVVSSGFRWIQFDLPGSGKLEMIQPLDPTDANHFLVRFLDDNGEGLHHLTFKVTDIEQAVARAGQLDLEVVGADFSNPGWKEAFIHPKSANGVLIQIAEWVDGPPSGRQLQDVLSGTSS